MMRVTPLLLTLALLLGGLGCASAGAPVGLSLAVLLAALLSACGSGPSPARSSTRKVEGSAFSLAPIQPPGPVAPAEPPVADALEPAPAVRVEPEAEVREPVRPRIRPAEARPSTPAARPRAGWGGVSPPVEDCDGKWVQTGRMLRSGPRWVCDSDRVRVRLLGGR